MRPEELTTKQKEYQPIAVMFIPRTEAGELISAMREVENKIQDAYPMKTRRLKLVEEGGLMIRNLLRADPWNKQPCQKPQCNNCKGKEGKTGSCGVRSLVHR